MWDVQLLDEQKRVVQLTWAGLVPPHEVTACNVKLGEVFTKFGGQPWRILVYMPDVQVFPAETQALIVAQQRWVLEHGCERSAAVVKADPLLKMQLDRTRKASDLNERESRFFDRDAAFASLMAD